MTVTKRFLNEFLKKQYVYFKKDFLGQKNLSCTCRPKHFKQRESTQDILVNTVYFQWYTFKLVLFVPFIKKDGFFLILHMYTFNSK